jgi:hypothetical protein
MKLQFNCILPRDEKRAKKNHKKKKKKKKKSFSSKQRKQECNAPATSSKKMSFSNDRENLTSGAILEVRSLVRIQPNFVATTVQNGRREAFLKLQ